MVTAMIVCCYGNFDEAHRTRFEMNGYKQYLKGVARLIADEEPTHVILCGGLTRPELGISEAASVRPYLAQLLRQPGYDRVRAVRLLTEERGLNAAQNLKFGTDRLPGLGDGVDPVIFVSDEIRSAKTRVLAWRQLGPSRDGRFAWLGSNLRWKVVGLPRPDVHPNSTRRTQLVETLKYLVLPRRKVFA